MKYKFSTVYNCKCPTNYYMTSPRIITNLTIEDLDLLLEDAKRIEHRQFESCCSIRNYTEIIIHCRICSTYDFDYLKMRF